MGIKNTLIYKYAVNIYVCCRNKIVDHKRRPLMQPVKALLESFYPGKKINEISLISSNCFAGRIMQDLNLPYNSPTLGLYFMYPDYIEFLSNIRFYLTEAKIEFVEHSKYPIGDERRAKWRHWYPIGLLDGKVEIHFLHYYTEKEAAENGIAGLRV